MIVTSLEQFKQPLKYYSVKLLSGLNTNFEFGKYSVTLNDFLETVKGYMQQAEPVVNQFKA
jgi:hypothetical protein